MPVTVFLALVLTGCGGGSGGGGGVPASPVPVFTPRADPCTSRAQCPNIDPADVGELKAANEGANNEYDVHYRLSDFNNGPSASGTDHHLENINAAAAYARGATGAGEVIAIVDTGIRHTHKEFAGKTVTRVQSYSPSDEDKNHGTYVASIAAGTRDNDNEFLNTHGVAFDANIHFTNLRLGSGGGVYRPLRLQNWTALDDISRADRFRTYINNARNAGAAVLNLSFGLNGAISSYNLAEVRSRFSETAAVEAQNSTPDADKVILVWGAGNAAGRTPNFNAPEIVAGLGAAFTGQGGIDLRKNTIAVVALEEDEGGTNSTPGIASYSNHCGIAKSFCIAAPGSGIVAANSRADNDYGFSRDDPSTFLTNEFRTERRTGRGTSFAAPIVSGALAVMRQYFKNSDGTYQLGNTELVSRLLATANRAGIYANSDIYGHGLVDLDAATRPFGTTTVLGVPFAQNSLTPGAPFGDAVSRSFAKHQIAGFDSLNTPFSYNLGGFVKKQTASTLAPLQQLHAAMPAPRDKEGESWLGAGGFALNVAPYGGEGNIETDATSHLRLAKDGFNLNLMNRKGMVLSAFASKTKNHGAPKVAGVTFAWQPHKTSGSPASLRAGKSQVGFGGGYLREADEVLFSHGEGAFGNLSSQTVFLAVGGRREINQWRFIAGTEIGAVFTDGDRLFDDVSSLITSSFSLGAERALFERNKIHFGLSQPLRVELGEANITLPTGRTQTGEIVHRKITSSLRPSGRQVDATATWQRALPIGHFILSARVSHQPNHTADASTNIATLASYRLDF